VSGRLLDIALGLLAGLLLAGVLTSRCYDHQLKAVQDNARHSAEAARARVAESDARNDSLRQRTDSILATRAPIIRQAVQDTASANAAARSLAAARTVRDTNVALRLEIQQLRRANLNLWVALQQSDQAIALERARGDSLHKVVGEVNLRLQTLAAQIEDLKPPPRWLSIGWKAVAAVGLVKVGYDLGHRH